MIIQATFYNEKCDICGSLADEEMWQAEPIRSHLECGSHWQHLGGKDYCPDCWRYDDNDNIVTADGHIWNENTEELIE